jgi:hypothetical protein
LSAEQAPGGKAMTDERQRKANVRLALILASVALVFALGFIAKIAFMGPH